MTDSTAPGLGSFVNIFGNIALLFPLGLFLLLKACPKLAPTGEGRAQWALPLACWLAVIAASTISDLSVLW